MGDWIFQKRFTHVDMAIIVSALLYADSLGTALVFIVVGGVLARIVQRILWDAGFIKRL